MALPPKCQQFIELVREGRDAAELLAFGSDELYDVYDCASDAELSPGPDGSAAGPQPPAPGPPEWGQEGPSFPANLTQPTVRLEGDA